MLGLIEKRFPVSEVKSVSFATVVVIAQKIGSTSLLRKKSSLVLIFNF